MIRAPPYVTLQSMMIFCLSSWFTLPLDLELFILFIV